MERSDEIVRVEGFELTYGLPEPVGNSVRTFDRRQALLVRLTTRAGAVGWGESWAFPSSIGGFIRSAPAPPTSALTPPRHARYRRIFATCSAPTGAAKAIWRSVPSISLRGTASAGSPQY